MLQSLDLIQTFGTKPVRLVFLSDGGGSRMLHKLLTLPHFCCRSHIEDKRRSRRS